MRTRIIFIFAALMLVLAAMPTVALQRVPYLEEFTSPTCGPCAPAVAVFDEVITTWPNTVSAIQYHMSWPGAGSIWYNPPGQTRRSYYVVNSIPRGYVDGVVKHYSQWVAMVQSELDYPSPIELSLSGTYDTATNTAHITTTVYAEGEMGGTGHKIYVAIAEDDLTSLGRHHDRVERTINANGLGEDFSINAGETKDYNCDLTVDPSEWKMNDLRIIAWVQSDAATGRDVQNSNFAFLSILTGFPTAVSPTSVGNIKASYR